MTGVRESARALRVAYVFAVEPGYSETFVRAEMAAVAAAGARVEAIAALPGRGGRGALARAAVAAGLHPVRLVRGARSLGYGARGVLAAVYAEAILARLRAFDADVVHTHFVNVPAAVAVLLGRAVDRPATALAHAADFLLDPDPAALRRRAGALDELFVISDAAAAQLRERGVDLDGVRHRIVRACFDGVVTPIAPATRAPGDPLRLVTIARLVEKKGIGTAVEAVAALRASGVDVGYDVYGDGPLLESLRARVEELGVGASVRLHGAVPHATAMTALAEADVAVLPCQVAANGDVDGIPVFLMEAAARGVPVVTTAVSGIPELVAEGSGWLVPPEDPSALAAALADVAARPDVAHERARTLQARLTGEFSPGTQAQRLLQAWTALLAERGRLAAERVGSGTSQG